MEDYLWLYKIIRSLVYCRFAPVPMLSFIKQLTTQLSPSLSTRLKNTYRASKSRLMRQSILTAWEKAGRPVPTPHEVKQLTIEQYQAASQHTILVETGTYLGDMIEAQRTRFKQLFSIELSQKLWENATERFIMHPHIHIIQGDSGHVLQRVVDHLTQPAVFWLDGHYSSGITARGEKDCPIFGEIDAICSGLRLNHILLVDDARCFTGEGDYPTIDELTAYIQKKQPEYQVEVKDDIIRYTVAA